MATGALGVPRASPLGDALHTTEDRSELPVSAAADPRLRDAFQAARRPA